MNKCKVMVYGTLKKGHGNHRLLERSTLLGTTETGPKYTMLHLGGFPGILRGGETPIQGEVYEVNEDTLLGSLDRLEGYPSFYDREITTTKFGDAWIYFLANDKHYEGCPVVKGGEW